MRQSADEIKKRIDFFRQSGRPVPLILEARLVRITSKKKLKTKRLEDHGKNSSCVRNKRQG